MKHSKRIAAYLILFFIAVSLSSFNRSNNSKLSPRLSQVTALQNPVEENLVWIFFKDKGPESSEKLSKPSAFLTKESIERRIKRVKRENAVDYRDIPLYSSYLNDLTESGIRIKQKSKWFNGISCYANKSQLDEVMDKGFVEQIDLVQKFSKRNDLTNDVKDFDPGVLQNDASEVNYGPSFNQVNIINVPPVHNLGNSGDNILIASFDAGFDNLQHPCFKKILDKGLRTYDFVNGDTIVANGPGRKGQGFHGTLTLSQICGYDPGFLISPAFNSRYLLAKTENTQSETPLEEDNWIAAAEWADSLGAEIITSSLGYLQFDPAYTSYTWESMDGNTPRITRAADIAVSKGIVVVISSGNEGYNQSHNTLCAPADGDSVITVGSVDVSKVRAEYSSIGPTADGRIKPDVMAMGTHNYTAKFGPGSIGYSSTYFGTSLACPMVAGVCALMLNANPELSPIDVRNILRNTADNKSTPNNLVGWGIVDAYSAVQNAITTNITSPADYQLLQNYPNPFNPSTTFRFNLNKSAMVSLVVYNVAGKEVDRPVSNKFFTVGNNEVSYTNPNISSGVYFYSLLVNGVLIETKKMMLIY